MLLKKMDPYRLKGKPTSKNDYCTHECEHCGKLMKLAHKVKGCLKSKPRVGTGRYHAACTARHLENHCNEGGLASTQQHLIEKSNKRTKHEDEATIKTEKFQEEAAFTQSKHKRGGSQ